jgi:23S rRNA (adenine1618-N6)-methyltransferase
MQLTKTLLEADFGLRLGLPDDRLCPPVCIVRLSDGGVCLVPLATNTSQVPNRHNYILWLKDLMDTTSYKQPGRELCGLDVGTGASCIYPLLGTAQRPWRFVATGELSPGMSEK